MLRERRLRALQEMHVLRRERAALVVDQHAVDRLGVALGKLQLFRRVEILVLRDADDQRIAARHRGLDLERLVARREDQIARRLVPRSGRLLSERAYAIERDALIEEARGQR